MSKTIKLKPENDGPAMGGSIKRWPDPTPGPV